MAILNSGEVGVEIFKCTRVFFLNPKIVLLSSCSINDFPSSNAIQPKFSNSRFWNIHIFNRLLDLEETEAIFKSWFRHLRHRRLVKAFKFPERILLSVKRTIPIFDGCINYFYLENGKEIIQMSSIKTTPDSPGLRRASLKGPLLFLFYSYCRQSLLVCARFSIHSSVSCHSDVPVSLSRMPLILYLAPLTSFTSQGSIHQQKQRKQQAWL